MSIERILSVGIDIGTATTQVIFSLLSLSNTAGYFNVPQVSIVEKEVVYNGEIHTTPLISEVLINGDEIREIVRREFKRAGYQPSEVQTGAVIITGESARKENAAIVLDKLSEFAGDFVVSTAGPDIESAIAGMGSGAQRYSKEHHCCVMNLDIGGGTTNVAVFDDGELVGTGCVDIGGRQICVDREQQVVYVSESAGKIARSAVVDVEVGRVTALNRLEQVTDRMAGVLAELVAVNPSSSLLQAVKTKGSSDLILNKEVKALSFSGGVAEFIYRPVTSEGVFPYGDIGALLGRSIRNNQSLQQLELLVPEETIQATVVGAGTYSTSLSGSTITYSADIFPIKNVPVLKLSAAEEATFLNGQAEQLKEKIQWFLKQNDTTRLVLAFNGPPHPSYEALTLVGQTLAVALEESLAEDTPFIIVSQSDIAKALGQILKRRCGPKREIVVLDSIKVADQDYVDMGKPVMQGMVIPVVIKTLVFN